MQQVCILGATGSIGESTLDVISRHPDLYSVFALTTNTRVEKLVAQAKICRPKFLVVADPEKYLQTKQLASDAGLDVEILSGPKALAEVAAHPQTDIVMAAIVGAAGLQPTLAAVKSSKRVLLANKESLVMSGELFMQAVRDHNAILLPVDSEHNAIFQSLPLDYQYGDLDSAGISKILLTGSGGPFLRTPMDELNLVTPEQACAHPNWDMGRKISVDSATMMNKGLEYIEARWLFGLQCDDIQVVLHPQSVIHSMVQYRDGSVIAQMGNPDMRTPIAHCLAFPNRIDAGVSPLDFSSLADFTFAQPDFARYPNLRVAIQACKEGQAATTCLNAANEIAVEAFLNSQIEYTDIVRVNEQTLAQIESRPLNEIEHVLALDVEARVIAKNIVNRIS